MFEGIPTYPDSSRWWQIVDKYKVNIFYTAPTAIRALMGLGDDFVKKTKTFTDKRGRKKTKTIYINQPYIVDP